MEGSPETTVEELKKKARIRRTLEEQLAEKERKILELKAQAKILKRKQSAQKRKARARVLIQLGARWAAANKLENVEHLDPSSVPDSSFLHAPKEDPVSKRRNRFIQGVGVLLLCRCGINSNEKLDAMSDEEQKKFFRFIKKVEASMLRYQNWKDGDTGSYWSHWDGAWESFCKYPEDIFFERTKDSQK